MTKRESPLWLSGFGLLVLGIGLMANDHSLWGAGSIVLGVALLGKAKREGAA